MTRVALQAAGMMSGTGDWTGKYGISSTMQFLRSPEAQEKALTDFLRDTERQLRANGSFDYLGRHIEGRIATFTIARAGLIAASHREGAPETRHYLDTVEKSGFSSATVRTSASKPASEDLRTRLMNNEFVKRAAAALLILSTVMATSSFAQQIVFGKSLTPTARQCLSDMLRNGHWRLSPQFHQEMIAAAVVARLALRRNGHKQYIFVITDSCGTAGCSMLIGEVRKDGSCHEIYSGSGFHEAMADSGFKPGMTVLRKRDHGYRRLLAPCELRFDGHEYQQIHNECPTIDVQR